MEDYFNASNKEPFIVSDLKNIDPEADLLIEEITERNENEAAELIRKNFDNLEEAGSVLASTYLRIENLLNFYSQGGSKFLLAKHKNTGELIGCVGLGPLAGLPYEERIGEIRDFVIDETFRGLGLGSYLLGRCLKEAKALDYKRIYLSTTPQMKHAQKLFLRFGFKPVVQQSKAQSPVNDDKLPCYFVLEKP
jgi:putative acetyltransferase